MIEIDLENTYEIDKINKDLSACTFCTEIKNGNKVELHISILKNPDEHLKGIYNLAFGPLNKEGEIDDKVIVEHLNIQKVFSTVLMIAITFLELNKEKKYKIGIDGSNDTRAYLYHRMFKKNYKMFSEFLIIGGADWYVKLLRYKNDIERDSEGYPYFKPILETFDLHKKSTELYRYYYFELK